MNTRLKFLLVALTLTSCTISQDMTRNTTSRPAAPVVVEPRVVVQRVVHEDVIATPVPKITPKPIVEPMTPPHASMQPTTITVEIRQPVQSESPIMGMVVKTLVQSLLDAPRKSNNQTTVTIALPDALTSATLVNGGAGTSNTSKPPYAFFIALIAVLAIQWIAGKTKWAGKK